MPYSKSIPLQAFITEVDAMIVVIKSTYKNKSASLETKEYVLSCSIMLCSAKIEVYIADFFDSWIVKVNASALLSAALPNNLKTLYLNQPFLNNAYKKLIMEGSESKFIDSLTNELSNIHFNLTDPLKPLPNLNSKIIYQNKKYPSPDNLTALYKRVGIRSIFTEINRISRADLESALTSFNNVRTAISHNGIPVGINDKDIIKTLRSAKRIVSFIDKAIYNHININSAVVTWPA